MESAHYLDSLLDSIDKKKQKLISENSSSSSITPSNSSEAVSIDPVALYTWTKHFDANTKQFYYHNTKSNITQWEKPPVFEDDVAEAPVVSYASFSTSTSSSFSTGGQESYWEKTGRANDREGRQLSAFFDTNTFEQNREEAAKLKLMRQQGKDKAMKAVDWSKVKEEKKRKRISKLLSDV